MQEVEEKIRDVHLSEELSKRYLSYAMSTIVDARCRMSATD